MKENICMRGWHGTSLWRSIFKAAKGRAMHLAAACADAAALYAETLWLSCGSRNGNETQRPRSHHHRIATYHHIIDNPRVRWHRRANLPETRRANNNKIQRRRINDIKRMRPILTRIMTASGGINRVTLRSDSRAC